MYSQKTVFAYEPAWAIGTGIYAQPETAEEMHQMIRALIAEKNPNYAKQVKIIYGGSLTPENSESLFSMENIDGGLVGRCSIDPQSFIKLCHVANQLNCGEKG